MNKKTYLTVLALLLINFICLFIVVFNLEKFIFEFFISIIFLLTAIILVYSIYKNKIWSNKLAMAFFAANLLNIAFIFPLLSYNIMYLGLIILIVNIMGFSYFTTRKKAGIIRKIGHIELPKTVSIVEPRPAFAEYKQVTKPPKTIKKTFKPGKYVASKTGTKYHSPKCDWAKRISKKNRVWLRDKAEARKKGYKKCSCVK